MKKDKPTIDIDNLLDFSEEVDLKKVGSDDLEDLYEEDETLIVDDDEEEGDVVKTYDGPGVVLDAEEVRANQIPDGKKVGTMQEQRAYDGAREALKDMDEQIEQHRQRIEKLKSEGKIPQDAKIGDKAVAKTDGSVVNIYLDKAQVGQIQFTPEEQRKIEYAQKIVVTEKTNLEFSTLKIRNNNLRADASDEEKKERKKSRLTLIKRAFDRTLSPFIALGSGYMGKMGNCSTADIIKLGQAMENKRSLTTELSRWSLLYDKMKECSVADDGVKFHDFDTFMKETAYDDYDNLQYALICASFPDNTTMRFTCPKDDGGCGERFEITTTNKELIRTDMVDERMSDEVRKILEANTFLETAKAVHNDAPFNKTTRISVDLDNPTIILDLYSPSAYDAIYRIYQELSPEFRENEEYSDYVDLLRIVKAAYILSEDDDDTYDKFEEPDELVEILHMFNDEQISRLLKYIQDSYLSHKYQYGIKEIICPHCKHNLGAYPMNMDSLLFLKVRQRQI